MKNFISLLIITFALLILSNVESYGQYCESGYSFKAITLNIGGCDYDIGICYRCAITHPGDVKIVFAAKHLVNPPCIGWSYLDVLNYAYAYVSTGQFIWTELCQDNIPPCESQNYKEFTVSYWHCWEEVIDTDYFGVPTLIVRPCEYENACIVKHKYCFDAITNSIVDKEDPTILSPFPDEPDCPDYENRDPCFRLPTPCWP